MGVPNSVYFYLTTPMTEGIDHLIFFSCGKWYIISLTTFQPADTLNPAKSSKVETNPEL
jgi:hypothetical protein